MPICPKCGSEVKEGYKFCTKCGQPMMAPVTNESVKSFDKQQVLTKAKPELQVEAPKPAPQPVVISDVIDDVDVVRGKAIWNIQRGQIARRISESEFAEIEKLKGVIIQEGCTAVVYVDGEQIGLLSGGAYTFPKKTAEQIQEDRKKAEEELDKETNAKKKEQKRSFMERGLFGYVGNGIGLVRQFLIGQKKGEVEQAHQRRVQRIEQRLREIHEPKLIRVYLVSDRFINLTFGGGEDADGNTFYAPFKVPMKVVDVDIAVSLEMQINDIHQFSVNYLADKDSASTLEFRKMLSPVVETIVRQTLRNLDYQQEGLPEPLVNNLKSKIQNTINERIYGIKVTQVLDITDSSANFERFRSVERELFCSEKELEFLQRTGELRNRLTIETNNQTIQEARNGEDLKKALQDINKDGLLREDELEEFVQMLESQRRIREAKTEEEEYEAMQGFRRSRLVNDDDIAALENSLSQGKIDRENVTELMRIQAAQKVRTAQQIVDFELSDREQDHEMAQELREAQHRGAVTAAEIETLRQKADFQFEQNQRQKDAEYQSRVRDLELKEKEAQAEYERARQGKFDDVDILARKAEIARQNLQAMQEHEREMHRMDVDAQTNRDNLFANMTADQIRAAQLAHLDAAAQAEMARSYGSDKENELLRQMMDRDERSHEREKETMLEMARMMQQGMIQAGANQTAMQQQRIAEMKEMKDEYRENMIHQQSRLDANQDRALNYTTRPQQTVVYPQSPPPQPVNSQPVQQKSADPAPKVCPNCEAEVAEGETFCMECGTRIA